jgi:hypothetical protein
MLRALRHAALLSAALILAAPLLAQAPTNIYTPEVHIGSATEPSTVTVPLVMEVPGAQLNAESPFEPEEDNAPPASTELLATRHFDFITSPVEGVIYSPSGHMADTTISLGEYARQLRAQKQKPATQSTPDVQVAPYAVPVPEANPR